MHRINPGARVVPIQNGRIPTDSILNTGLFDFNKAQAAPAWKKALLGEDPPETEEYGIGSFVYRAREPFHPARLMPFVQAGVKGLLRSKGFLWLATRPFHVGTWSTAGPYFRLEPAGTWWAGIPKAQWPQDAATRKHIADRWHPVFGDRRQEIVFIGQGLDREGITSRLNDCLLTEAEILEGPRGWAQYDDPFPSWEAEAADAAN